MELGVFPARIQLVPAATGRTLSPKTFLENGKRNHRLCEAPVQGRTSQPGAPHRACAWFKGFEHYGIL